MLFLNPSRTTHSEKVEAQCLKNFHEGLCPQIQAAIASASANARLGDQSSSSELKISDSTIDPSSQKTQEIFTSLTKK